jgi:hypothetical protein
MTEKIEIEVWVAIDADGEYDVGTDSDDAVGRYSDNVGGSGALRVVKLTLKISPPKPTEAEIDVPDTAGETVEGETA